MIILIISNKRIPARVAAPPYGHGCDGTSVWTHLGPIQSRGLSALRLKYAQATQYGPRDRNVTRTVDN